MPGLPRDGDAVYFAVHPVAGTERQCNYCGTPGGAERRCRRCCCWQEFLSGRVFAAKATAALAWAVNHQMYATCMHAWKQQRQPIGSHNSCGGAAAAHSLTRAIAAIGIRTLPSIQLMATARCLRMAAANNGDVYDIVLHRVQQCR